MDYLIPICAIQFGYDFCTAASNCTLNEDQMNYVKERCVKFVVELLKEVQMGLPDYIDTLPMMKQLHPKIATAQCKGQIGQVAYTFAFTFNDMDNLENEWNALVFEEWPKECFNTAASF